MDEAMTIMDEDPSRMGCITYTIAEESKKLKEELALMEKLEHEQDELECLR